MKASDRGRNVKSKEFLVVLMNFVLVHNQRSSQMLCGHDSTPVSIFCVDYFQLDRRTEWSVNNDFTHQFLRLTAVTFLFVISIKTLHSVMLINAFFA